MPSNLYAMNQSEKALQNALNMHFSTGNIDELEDGTDSAEPPAPKPICALHSIENPNRMDANNISMYFFDDGSSILINSDGMKSIS